MPIGLEIGDTKSEPPNGLINAMKNVKVFNENKNEQMTKDEHGEKLALASCSWKDKTLGVSSSEKDGGFSEHLKGLPTTQPGQEAEKPHSISSTPSKGYFIFKENAL